MKSGRRGIRAVSSIYSREYSNSRSKLIAEKARAHACVFSQMHVYSLGELFWRWSRLCQYMPVFFAVCLVNFFAEPRIFISKFEIVKNLFPEWTEKSKQILNCIFFFLALSIELVNIVNFFNFFSRIICIILQCSFRLLLPKVFKYN